MSTRWQREMYATDFVDQRSRKSKAPAVAHEVEEPVAVPEAAPASAATGTPKIIATEAEFTAALAAAPGSVLVDFGSQGCGFCDDEAPKVQKIAAECANVTVLKVDVDQLSELADKFNVQGTPTLMYAPTGAQMTPEAAEEMADSGAARRRIKCARTKK